MTNKQFGKRLKAYITKTRAYPNLLQFCNAHNLTYSTIYEITEGQSSPTTNTLKELGAALKMDYIDLLHLMKVSKD